MLAGGTSMDWAESQNYEAAGEWYKKAAEHPE